MTAIGKVLNALRSKAPGKLFGDIGIMISPEHESWHASGQLQQRILRADKYFWISRPVQTQNRLLHHRASERIGVTNLLAGEFARAALLKTVYTRAGIELTDPQEGCKLKDIQIKSSGEQPCLGVRQC